MLRATLFMLGLGAFLVTSSAGAGGNDSPYPGTQTFKSAYGFPETVARLEKSIDANKMGLVERCRTWSPARTSAHRFATTRCVVDQAANGALLAPPSRASSGMPSRCR